MADDDYRKLDPAALRANLYGDALTDATKKIGRNLLLVAVVTIFVHLFNVSLKSTPYVAIDFSQNPNALGILLAVTSFGLLVAFSLRAVTDILRARETWAEVQSHLLREKVFQAGEAARSIDDSEPNPNDDGSWLDPWWESYYEIREDAEKQLAQIRERIGRRQVPIIVWWTRLIVESSTPFCVGIVALVLSRSTFIDLVQALAK
jgi:hypothetical protein